MTKDLNEKTSEALRRERRSLLASLRSWVRVMNFLTPEQHKSYVKDPGDRIEEIDRILELRKKNTPER
jgi:hypothetical protein